MRLLPRSLAGRMILVLLLGLLLAQLASAVILLRDRGVALYQASGLQAARSLAGVVHALDALDAQQRRRLIRAFNTEQSRAVLATGPVSLSGEDERREAVLRAILRRALGDDRPVQVAVLERSADAPLPDAHAWPHMNGEETRPRMRQRMLPFHGTAFVAQIELRDGSWVRFEHRLPEELTVWPQRLFLSLLILLVSVIALSLLAVRWLTRPLRLLGGAAEALGRDIHRPPLSEKGPLEVRRAAHAFNTMQRRIARYLQDRELLLSSVSHDLRTPLTRLRLRAEMLDDDALRAKLLHDVDDMEAMVGATLDFMRAGAEREPLQPVNVDALLESLQADREEMGQSMTITGRARAPYPGRPVALKRCLDNLVDNAIKHGQRASVEIADDAAALTITVADGGPGLPESELGRVFEPFYRLEASRSRETGGVGLGLAIARSIARAHGGELTLQNRAEGGLAAVLVLPR